LQKLVIDAVKLSPQGKSFERVILVEMSSLVVNYVAVPNLAVGTVTLEVTYMHVDTLLANTHSLPENMPSAVAYL
jgi:hypothetical protein